MSKESFILNTFAQIGQLKSFLPFVQAHCFIKVQGENYVKFNAYLMFQVFHFQHGTYKIRTPCI